MGVVVLLLGPALEVVAQQLPIVTYTTADGLPHNTIKRIVKDSRGFLWFCTAEGLSRFDGYSFTNFGSAQGLPHSSINDLLETRSGKYWLATAAGLVSFNPKGRPRATGIARGEANPAGAMFTTVPPADAEPRSGAVTVVRERRDGTIWAGTENGLYRLDETGVSPVLRAVDIGIPDDYPEQRFVGDVLEDAQGSLWVAVPNGLYRTSPDGHTTYYTEVVGLKNDYTQALFEDRTGRLWVGTRLGGILRVKTTAPDGPIGIDLRFTYPQLPTSWISQMTQTSDGRFWMATARGLVEFSPAGDGHGRHLHAYSTSNGLSGFLITSIAEDDGGDLWLGTGDGGAMRLARSGFTSYGERAGLKYVNAIFEDGTGRLCFKGIVLGDARTSVFEGARLDAVSTEQPSYHVRYGCFDGERFSGFTPGWPGPEGWPAGWVMEQLPIRTRNGEWWIGSGGGVLRYAGADRFDSIKAHPPVAIYGVPDGLATPQVFRLFEDSGGNVWMSTIASDRNGLALWDAKEQRIHDLATAPGLPPLKGMVPRSFGEDASGQVWVGFDGAIARYRNGRFAVFTGRDGLPPGAIAAIHRDGRGRLWLASAQSGLVRVDDVTSDRPRFASYTTAEGLSSNASSVVVDDAAGHIYVGGGNGLDHLDPETGRVKHFSTADGLPAGLFRAAYRDRAGVLWFGMSSGLARFEPGPETPARAPSIFISALRVRGVPEPVSALGERAMSLEDLGPQQNQLQIDFAGLKSGRGDVLRYQYRLDGSDKEWSPPSDQRTVTYASLAPGSYTFTVRAADSDGVFSDPPATVTFTILPPLWQRAWFVALLTLSCAAAISAVYRYRVARLLEIANMRTRIATDLHDDIGSNLTRIALLSEVAAQSYGRRTPYGAGAAVVTDDGPLVSIARIARESVASMSDIVWAINPARETLLDLVRRMRQHADEIFTLRDIALRFDAPAASNDLRLSVDVRRDLLLIFKESVNNAARHSRCTRVDIQLHVDRSRIVLSVADDGVGFDVSKDSEGQGLGSMRRRARRLNGTLDLASIPGVRTTLTLTIPL